MAFLSPQEREEINKKTRLVTFCISGTVYAAIILLTGHAYYLKVANPRLKIMEAINQGFNEIITHPTHMWFGRNSFLTLFLLTILYISSVFLYTEYEKLKPKKKKIANGHLMTPAELKEYNKACTEPFGKTYSDGKNDVIISEDISLSLDNQKTGINLNLLALGKSGSGKSYFLAAPNILQFNTCLVMTDPSKELLHKYGKALENVGYEVMVFDIEDTSRSLKYNPFHYIRREKDVFTVVNTIIKNTTVEGSKGDDFWPKAEALLLKALMLYLWHMYDESEQTFDNVLKLIDLITTEQTNAQTESILDIMFKELGEADPGNLAVGQYKKFKKAADKTLQSILISLSSRIESFMLSDIRYLTSKDEMNFETFADSKKALFINIPNEDGDFNWIVSTLYTQLFQELYKYSEKRAEYGYVIKTSEGELVKVIQAENKKDSENAKKKAEKLVKAIRQNTYLKYNKDRQLYILYTKINNKEIKLGHRHRKEDMVAFKNSLQHVSIESCKTVLPNDGRCCPVHVRMLLDEFANIGQIPAFEKKLAVIRKYEISCAIILQSLSQLKTLYDNNKWNTIIGQCDTDLLLGTRDKETVEWFKEYIGFEEKEVINENLGNNKSPGSKSLNHQKEEVMSSFDIYTMPKDKCLVAVAGYPVHYGNKYKTRNHKNWSYVDESKGQFEIRPTSKDINIIPFRLRINKDMLAKEAIDAEKLTDIPTPTVNYETYVQPDIKEEKESLVEVGYIENMVINYAKTE